MSVDGSNIITIDDNGNKCVADTSVTNCAKYATALDGTSQVCVECATNYQAVYEAPGTAGLNVLTNYNNFIETVDTLNPFAQYHIITQCVDIANYVVLGTVGADGLISNCSMYSTINDTTNGDSYLMCVRCDTGYSGVTDTFTDGGGSDLISFI